MKNFYAHVIALRHRTQTFGVLVVLLIMLAVSMQTYAKRALQGRIRDASLFLVDSAKSLGNTTQYEPYYLQSQYAVTRNEAQVQILDNTTFMAGASRSQLAGLDKNIIPSLRMLIQKANYGIRVEDVHQTFEAIHALILQYDGILVDSTIQEGSNGHISGVTVFKVRPENYRQTVGSLDALGKVETKNLSTEDVGEEYTDLNARMQNAKVIRERLYQIVNAKTDGVKDILEVEREIARVSEEIERYQGRINYLQGQSAMATITIHYYKTIAPQIPVWSANFKQKMVSAWRLAVETFIGTFNVGILVLAVVIPIAFWIVIVSLIFYYGQRVFFRKKN